LLRAVGARQVEVLALAVYWQVLTLCQTDKHCALLWVLVELAE
jgi:hypothetical protein